MIYRTQLADPTAAKAKTSPSPKESTASTSNVQEVTKSNDPVKSTGGPAASLEVVTKEDSNSGASDQAL